MLKRVGETPPLPSVPIAEAGFPAPFASGLEYSVPARGGWTIVHVGMLIPEAHEIFVCASACLRGVVLSAAEMDLMDRFSTVSIEEHNVLEGDMEALIVEGVAEGCVQSGCALIGGETAEHPGLMPEDEYDVAGFCVGLADKPKMIDGSKLVPGDVLIGLRSSGVHSNGFSLVRKIFDINEETVYNTYPELDKPLGEVLLTPTKIYVKPILALMEQVTVKAVSHITGGGFYENIPRMLRDGLSARIDKSSIPVLPIFTLMQRVGNISEHDMFNTFNMGVGMVVAVAKEDAEQALDVLRQTKESCSHNEKHHRIGIGRRHEFTGAARRTGQGRDQKRQNHLRHLLQPQRLRPDPRREPRRCDGSHPPPRLCGVRRL